MNKIQTLITEVSGAVVGRDELVVNSVYGMLTGLNVLGYGPPGTAKSKTSRVLSDAIGGEVFVQQLDPNLSKEDIFGPLSLAALEEDRWERSMNGYAPTAHILHFDEVDRGGKAIEGALLTLLNERLVKNGTEEVPINARLIVGTTNGRISDAASWDRWAIKVHTPYLGADPDMLSKLLSYEPKDVTTVISVEEIDTARTEVEKVSIHDSIANEAHRIGTFIASSLDYFISDRKWTQIMKVLRASAYIDGRSETAPSDWWAARNLLWDDIESIPTVNDAISAVAGTKASNVAELEAKLKDIEADFQGIMSRQDTNYVQRAADIAGLMVRLNVFNDLLVDSSTSDIADRVSVLRGSITSAALSTN